MPRYIRPLKVLERVGIVAYRLTLPPSLTSVHEVFHVSMLRKYTLDPTHIMDWGELIVDIDGTFDEGLIPSLIARLGFARQDYEDSEGVVVASWSGGGNMRRGDTMCTSYPFLFKD